MTASPGGKGAEPGPYDDEAFDSTLDTLRHSRRVDELLMVVVVAIQRRMLRHDESKLHDPEKSTFDRVTPRLKHSTYGSDEYKGFLADMGPALEHHYAHNRHHPEHFEDGVDGMTLVDLVEMLCDWKAATERHVDGDLRKSLEIQAGRFEISEQLSRILLNTATLAGWLPPVPAEGEMTKDELRQALGYETYQAKCGNPEDHEQHHMDDENRTWCGGMCLCGSTHPDIPKGPHSKGEHK